MTILENKKKSKKNKLYNVMVYKERIKILKGIKI